MKILYLGLEVPQVLDQEDVIHYPVIRIVPRPPSTPEIARAFNELVDYTHLIFTSKSAVQIFCDYLPKFHWNTYDLRNHCIIAVGQATGSLLASKGLAPTLIAPEESSEGVVKMLEGISLSNANFLWPHSVLSRSVITDFFEANKIRYNACIFYDTELCMPGPAPNLNDIDEIVFSSPSTIDGFLQIYRELPMGKRLTTIGPVTRNHLNWVRTSHKSLVPKG